MGEIRWVRQAHLAGRVGERRGPSEGGRSQGAWQTIPSTPNGVVRRVNGMRTLVSSRTAVVEESLLRFDDFFEAFARQVATIVALSTGDAALAEDATQEAMALRRDGRVRSTSTAHEGAHSPSGSPAALDRNRPPNRPAAGAS
jgi:hypothetical protein